MLYSNPSFRTRRSSISHILLGYEDDDSETIDLMDLDIDISYSLERSVILQTWNRCLALSALLDFGGVVAHSVLEQDAEQVQHEVGLENSFVKALLTWLATHRIKFGIAFSVMWFIDAFVTAQRHRRKTLLEQDRLRLLESSIQIDRPEDGKKPDSLPNFNWWRSAQVVYVETILTQLLLLPVGFYVYCYGVVYRVNDADVRFTNYVTTEYGAEDFSYDSYATFGLVYIIVKHSYTVFSRFLGVQFHMIVRREIPRLAKQLAFEFIRNPFQLFSRYRRLLRTLRWIKYLAPVLATVAKLIDNGSDLMKKYKQRRDAVLARRIKELLWGKLTPGQRREHSARLVQSRYRAHLAKKKMTVLQQTVMEKEARAAQKLQRHFRSSLIKARERLKRKEEELAYLIEKEKQANKRKEHLKEQERRRMYMLQKELKNKARDLLNKRSLLRPNTKFAVTWKVIFVVAVLFEISQLAFSPLITTERDPIGNGYTIDFQIFLEQAILPTPVAMLDECRTSKTKWMLFDFSRQAAPNENVQFDTASTPWFCESGLISTLLAASMYPTQISSLPACSRDEETWSLSNVMSKKWTTEEANQKSPAKNTPWYCQSALYARLQTSFIEVLKESILIFSKVLAMIFFLDVFISFFTGELNSETGQLEPKTFFVRYMFPGIFFQLLTNPTLDTTVDMINFALTWLIDQGPLRVLRWTIALFFPASMALMNYLKKLWLWLVRNENNQAEKLRQKRTSCCERRMSTRPSRKQSYVFYA